MQSISQIILEENLVNFNFDSSHISSVLNEVLTLFKDQTKRINELEESIKGCAKNEDFDRLSAKFEDTSDDVIKELDELNHSIHVLRNDTEGMMKTMKDEVEDSALTTMGEARRLVTAEIQQSTNDDKIRLLEEKLNSVDEGVIKLQNDFDEITVPSVSNGMNPEEFGTIRISKLENRIKDIEIGIQNLPEVEQHLDDIMVQFPLMVRKVDKRLADFISNGPSIATARSNSSAVQINGNKSNDILGECPPPPTFPSVNSISSRKNNNDNNNNNTNEPEFVVESFVEGDSDNEEGNTENEEDDSKIKVMGEIDFNKIPRTLPSEMNSTSTTADGTPSKPKKIDFLKPLNNNSSLHDISILSARTEDGKVIKVFENRTYKTEMGTSVRVVSELEWAKGLIQQHHDAIRQLQQNLRTQQENFDTVTESIQRVNATHNSRISQIAQQVNKNKQDEEEMERKIVDQMGKIWSAMGNQKPQIIEVPVTQQPTYRSETPKKNMEKKKTKLEMISPLFKDNNDEKKGETEETSDIKTEFLENEEDENDGDNNEDENESTDSELHLSNSHTNNNSRLIQFKQLNEGENPEEKSGEATEVKAKKNNFTFTMNHFTLHPRAFMLSDIRTINDQEAENISHLELFNSNGYMLQKNRPSTTGKDTEREINKNLIEGKRGDLTPRRSELQPPDSKSNIYMNNQFLQMGRLPKREFREFTFDDIPTDLIEDRVTTLARKVVSILADSAKKDIQKQAEILKKTVDEVVTQIDGKIDREFVERMFNKFRVMLLEMNEKIENLQCSFLEWVTRDELEVVLQNYTRVIADVRDTAAVKSKYNCLLCGRPRQHLAGMMVKKEALVPAPMNGQTGNNRAPFRSSDSAITKPVVHKNSIMQDDFFCANGGNGTNDNRQRYQVPPRDVIQLLTDF